jgi:hypothetical protein
MLDSASITAIAAKTKSVIDNGKVLIDSITGLIAAVTLLVAYIAGHLHGTKSALIKKQE